MRKGLDFTEVAGVASAPELRVAIKEAVRAAAAGGGMLQSGVLSTLRGFTQDDCAAVTARAADGAAAAAAAAGRAAGRAVQGRLHGAGPAAAGGAGASAAMRDASAALARGGAVADGRRAPPAGGAAVADLRRARLWLAMVYYSIPKLAKSYFVLA
jgi:hypothetical protein